MNILILTFLHATYLTSSIHNSSHHDPQIDNSSFHNSTLELHFTLIPARDHLILLPLLPMFYLAQCHPYGFEPLHLCKGL